MSEKSELSVNQRLSNFFARHGKILVGIAILMIVVIIGAFVMDKIRIAKNEKATILAEDIIEGFSDWKTAEDDSEQEDAFMALIDEALLDFEGTFAEQRALYMRGQYYIEKEMWTEASADFYTLYDKYPESYLAVVSLFNAASTIEEAGSNEKAISYYQELVDNFKGEAPEVPDALFQLGRLSEKEGNVDQAIEYYEQLILDFSDTDWTNLAKSRIISLNI